MVDSISFKDWERIFKPKHPKCKHVAERKTVCKNNVILENLKMSGKKDLVTFGEAAELVLSKDYCVNRSSEIMLSESKAGQRAL